MSWRDDARLMEAEADAAKQLGLTPRHISRLVDAFERDGPVALVSKRRGRRSNHAYETVKVLTVVGGQAQRIHHQAVRNALIHAWLGHLEKENRARFQSPNEYSHNLICHQRSDQVGIDWPQDCASISIATTRCTTASPTPKSSSCASCTVLVTCGLPPESLMVRRRRSRGGARSQRRRSSTLGTHLGRRRASTTPFP